MSKINISQAVRNILPRTNSYSPLIEVIVNAIESIEEADRGDSGNIHIQVLRSNQSEIGGRLQKIEGFEIIDNGVRFTDVHREAFDTLYIIQKISKGGRGFGRFVCLKHFSSFNIESVFQTDTDELKSRKFSMGRDIEIIENEKVGPTNQADTGVTVRLHGLRGKTSFDLRLDMIAKVLVPCTTPSSILD